MSQTVSLILTFINKGKNTFSQISKYIGGMYAYGIYQTKTFLIFPTEDTNTILMFSIGFKARN
jgi:hypothetical protein